MNKPCTSNYSSSKFYPFQYKDCQGTILIHTDFYYSQNVLGNHLDGHISSYKSSKHSLLQMLLYTCDIQEAMLSTWTSFPQVADECCSCRALGQSWSQPTDRLPSALILKRPTPVTPHPGTTVSHQKLTLNRLKRAKTNFHRSQSQVLKFTSLSKIGAILLQKQKAKPIF